VDGSVVGDRSACCNKSLARYLTSKNSLTIFSRTLSSEDVDLNGFEIKQCNQVVERF
jgi:hypothetical protein